MKKKDSKETVRGFLTMITKKKRPKKFGLTRERTLLESLRNYAKLKDYEFTLHWVRPRPHLLNVQYDFWRKDNGYKYIHKLIQFVPTLNSRRNCSIDLIPKKLKNSVFLSILYSKPLRDFWKPHFKIGNRDRISKCDLPLKNGDKPQFTQGVFEIVAFFSRKPPTYTIKDEQDETIRGKFYQKVLVKVI